VTIKVSVRGTALGGSGVLLGLSDTTCETRGGYSDVGIGMQATVHDPSGTVIGFSTFEDVGVSTETEIGPLGGPIPTECTFTTIARSVPDAPSYGIEVGSRGTVQFRQADLAAHNWAAELSLGD
jgi:hypothetical protein